MWSRCRVSWRHGRTDRRLAVAIQRSAYPRAIKKLVEVTSLARKANVLILWLSNTLKMQFETLQTSMGRILKWQTWRDKSNTTDDTAWPDCTSDSVQACRRLRLLLLLQPADCYSLWFEVKSPDRGVVACQVSPPVQNCYSLFTQVRWKLDGSCI